MYKIGISLVDVKNYIASFFYNKLQIILFLPTLIKCLYSAQVFTPTTSCGKTRSGLQFGEAVAI